MSSSDQQVVVFVVGMHRSGTSALTRLLNLLGAEVGDRLLGSSPGINDKGFWEHQELVALDEEILGRMGRTWYDFRPWPDDWWQGETWSDLLPRATADYDDLLSNWRAVAEALGRGLDVLWPTDPAAVADQVAQELDPALRH